MHADILLIPLEDESIYSLIGRLSRVNGYSKQVICEGLLSSHSDQRTADACISLHQFIRATRMEYGDLKKVLLKHTNFTFRNVIATPLLNEKNSKKWTRSILSSNISLATLSNYEEHVWKWCPECVKQDLHQVGFTYWRVKHQLPGFFVCTKHGIHLAEVNIPFRNRQNNFFFPDSIISKNENNHNPHVKFNQDLAIQLCSISEGIQCFFEVNQFKFRKTIQNGMVSKGYINSSGQLSQDAIDAFGQYFDGLKSIKEIAYLTKKNAFCKHVKNLLFKNEINITYPLIIPMLILWVYQDWSLFKNYYHWETVMFANSNHKSANLDINGNNEINKNREICKKFLFRFPESNRGDFWRFNPKSCRWLNLYDSKWFSETLKKQSGQKRTQMEFFQ